MNPEEVEIRKAMVQPSPEELKIRQLQAELKDQRQRYLESIQESEARMKNEYQLRMDAHEGLRLLRIERDAALLVIRLLLTENPT